MVRPETAQLRYDPASHDWTLYWADRNSCWHRYADTDPDLLNEIDDDPTCIFWG